VSVSSTTITSLESSSATESDTLKAPVEEVLLEEAEREL